MNEDLFCCRLFGRGVIVAYLIIAFLLVSVELPMAFADSGVPANIQDMAEAAAFILRDILDIDLSKYPFKVRTTPDGEYMGLPEKAVVFTLERDGEFANSYSPSLMDAYAPWTRTQPEVCCPYFQSKVSLMRPRVFWRGVGTASGLCTTSP